MSLDVPGLLLCPPPLLGPLLPVTPPVLLQFVAVFRGGGGGRHPTPPPPSGMGNRWLLQLEDLELELQELTMLPLLLQAVLHFCHV